MSTRHRPTDPPEDPRDDTRARRWMLAAAVALTVARPLVVSDSSPERGDGIFFVVPWLVLLAAWFGWYAAARTRTRVRCATVDLAVLALALWVAVTAIVAAREGSPRAAINTLWEWLALAAGFFIFRQTIRDRYAARALLATMVSVAVALSVVGYLQAFYTMPRDRAYYEQIKDDPQAMAAAVGHWYPPGSRERQLYEQRLYSTEPTATFSLANSLAGFLATWLVVAIGLAAIRQHQEGRLEWRDWLMGLGVTVVIAGCLLLTKSRSATVATVVGLVLLAWIARPDWKRRLAAIAGGSAATLILIVTAASTGWWDREVLTEASKSFAYRLQYWRATWAMITDHPWLGCGPGHFQQTYTAYRLPAASEEIRDPHNFVLEVWATAGTPAAILLVAVLVLFFLAIRRSKNLAQDRSVGRPFSGTLRSEPALVTATKKRANGSSADHEGDRAGRNLAVFGGGACGLVFAALAAPVTGLPLSGITFATVAVTWLLVAWGTHRWADRSAPVDRLAAVAVVVLLVNLSAAGGIGYPGVAGSLWLLLAVGLGESDSLSQIRLVPSSLMWGATAVAVAVAGFCYWTTYRPVLESRGAIRQAQLLGPDRTVERTELLVRAADTDPLSTEAALLLADQRFRQWRERPSSTHFRQLRQAIERACRLAPAASHVWSQAGAWWWAVFERDGRGEALGFAREAYRKAVDRYPNQATLRIRYALVLEAIGERRAAATQAAAALKLDEVARHAGHRDQQLDTELRSAALRMASQGAPCTLQQFRPGGAAR